LRSAGYSLHRIVLEICQQCEARKHVTWGKWRYSSSLSQLGTRWSGVVNFMSRPFYPRERTLVHISLRLDGPQRRSGHFRVEKNLPLPRFESRAFQRVANRYID